jgi:enamine deaminase RidA (YjgF/YER057c/UK114 family)
MSVYERLKELNIVLPELPVPQGVYLPLKSAGGLVFLSGVLPFRDGELIAKGVVPVDVDIETARECARQVVLNALSILDSEIGLENIKGCIRVNGYVASDRLFYEQPKVLNGASELLIDIFGEAGRHTRVAVGVQALPLNSPLEIDFVFELKKIIE